MEEYQQRIFEEYARLAGISTDSNAEKETAKIEKVPAAENVSSTDTSTDSAENEPLAQDSPADEEIETFTATPAQLEFWHSYGGLTAQYLLTVCNFGYYDKIFDKYKVGYDVKDHAATFAIDDSRCYKIFFDSKDARPLDNQQAEKVLNQIIHLEQQK